MDASTIPELLTPKQVAELLQLPVRRIHEMRRCGVLPAVCLTGASKARAKTFRFPTRGVLAALGLDSGADDPGVQDQA